MYDVLPSLLKLIIWGQSGISRLPEMFRKGDLGTHPSVAAEILLGRACKPGTMTSTQMITIVKAGVKMPGTTAAEILSRIVMSAGLATFWGPDILLGSETTKNMVM